MQVSVIEVRTVCLIIPITSMAIVCIPTWQSFIRNTSNSSKMPCLFCSYSACLSRYLWFTEHRVTGERKNGKKRGHEAPCGKSRNFSTTQFYVKSIVANFQSQKPVILTIFIKETDLYFGNIQQKNCGRKIPYFSYYSSIARSTF